MGLVYEIRLAEPPEPTWVEQFAGWEVQAHPGGGSLLRREIAEHAALLDVHARVQHMELLQHLVAALGGRMRIPVELQVIGSRPLPADLQVALYRIAQEALQNIAKHAKGSRASVALQLSSSEVVLEIRDDGRGFDPTAVPGDHFGLQIMRERMAAAGGSMTLESQLGQGTTLKAQWPVQAGGEEA